MLDELIQDQIMNQIKSGSDVIGDQSTASEQEQDKKSEGEQEKQVSQKETQREYNIREMRKRLEESERRARELEEQVKQQRAPSLQQANNAQPMDELNIGDDDLIEGKHLKKYVSNIAKQFERKLEEMNSNSAANAADQRLKAQYQDFDHVVSQENLKSLAAIYPEEYNSIMANPDIYGKAKTAYTMIKNLGIAENQYEDTDRRLAQNRSKPRAAASVAPQAADTPLSRIGDYDRRILSESDKQRLRDQVARAKAFGG